MNRRPRSYQERALPLSYLGSLHQNYLVAVWFNASRRIGWWRGQDSNLRSPSGRQIYSLVALTTHPPLPGWPARSPFRWFGAGAGPPGKPIPPDAGKVLEPQRGLEPLTCRLQIDCATIAPQGQEARCGLEKSPAHGGQQASRQNTLKNYIKGGGKCQLVFWRKLGGIVGACGCYNGDRLLCYFTEMLTDLEQKLSWGESQC